LRRVKASSESFAGLIAGSFIIAALAEEWRVAVLNGSQPEKGGAGHLSGEDAFTFARDGHHSVSAADIGTLVPDGASRAGWDGAAETAAVSEFDLSIDGTAAANVDQDDTPSMVAHHHAGWLITDA
jgi:hypothetical protein